jgi:hypothetical protein
VLVFYNDNKASFQQFVDMMRNERDRQYQEDLQLLVMATENFKSSNKSQENQKVIDDGVQGLTKEVVETMITEDCLQRERVVEESEYEDNNDHGALRFVINLYFINFPYLNIIFCSQNNHNSIVFFLKYI